MSQARIQETEMRKSFNLDTVVAATSQRHESRQDPARDRAAEVHAWAVRTLARNGFGGEFIVAERVDANGAAATSITTSAVAANLPVRRLVAAMRRRRAAH
jgi:hypothetical protein